MIPSWLQNTPLSHLPLYLFSLAMGLFIGLDRERTAGARAGLRTFGLTALLGTMLAHIGQQLGSYWPFLAGLGGVAAFIVGAYRQVSPDEDPGTTSQVALLVAYALGGLVWLGEAQLAATLTILVVALLALRAELHGWSRNLTRRELLSFLQLGALTFVIMPVLPNRGYGPYGVLNPHEIWLMVILIAGMGLAGYLALRLVGERHGGPLLGIFGGLVSSTATSLVYARHTRDGNATVPLAAQIIVWANLVLLVRLCILAGLLHAVLLSRLIPVLGLGLAAGLAVMMLQRARTAPQDAGAQALPEIKNPTEMKTALTFGGLYALILLVAAWLQDVAGSSGVYLAALAGGLTDADASVLSSLKLAASGILSAPQTVSAVVLAVLANLVFKLALVFWAGTRELGWRCLKALLPVTLGLLLGLALLWWTPWL